MSALSDPDIPLWSLIPSTSKDIKYSALSWDEPIGHPFARLDFGLFGEPPFSDTSVAPINHVGQASVFYNFTGTRVVVETTVDNIPNDSAWRMTCRVDEQDFPVASDIWNRRANGVPLCDAKGLSPDSAHSLNFTIHVDTAPDHSPQLYFDLLKVTPSTSTNLENALVYIHHDTSMVAYDDAAWKRTDFGHYTTVNGSQVVVSFSGTRLWWYGFYDPAFGGSREESKATFVLDNYPSQTFTIPRISASPSATQIGEPHLNTVELPPGMHRLEVNYASMTGRPLGLHHLVIQNAPLPSDISTSLMQTPTPSHTLSSTPQAARSGGVSKPAIIAIAINVVVGTLVVMGIVVFFWRRRKSKSSAAKKAQPFISYLRSSPASDQNSGKASEGASSTSATTPKGTNMGDIPIPRGSLHIRTVHQEEMPPPYQYMRSDQA